MVDGISTQHYSWRLWGWSVLSGPMERGSGQTVQLWRPGHLDFDRRSSDRGWLCGTSWRFSLYLKQSFGDMAGWFVLSSPSHCFTLKDWRSEMLCSWHVCLPELAVQHVLIPSANRQEVISSLHQRCLYPHKPSDQSQSFCVRLLPRFCRWICAGRWEASHYVYLVGLT